MLNSKGERELVYTVRVDDVRPIPGKDRVECAVVGGWTCMVPKGQFCKGDIGIYFEIDSLCPKRPEFEFLEKRNYKIKTQRFKTIDGHFFSQGLLMGLSDFNGEYDWVLSKQEEHVFLTEKIGVTYNDPADNIRKSSSTGDKYKKMASRHPKLFQNRIIRKIYKSDFGKKILFIFFGSNKKDKKKDFPEWVVKTDEERIQNLVDRIPEFRKVKWIATEKRDGTSTTMTLIRRGHKYEYAVCSRNVRMDEKDHGYYDTNVYVEMSEKYHLKDALTDLLSDDYMFVTIQGETFGSGIQKRDYGIGYHEFEVFNVIFGKNDGTTQRLNPIDMTRLMKTYGIPTVPIVAEDVELPETCEEILNLAGGEAFKYGGMREGLVFRTYDGKWSFKAVDNEYLTKYHG